MLNVRDKALDDWLAKSPEKGESFVYHRGHLAYDKKDDPELAALADRMQGISNTRFDIISVCGHVRGEVIGTGVVELLTRPDRGETIYYARKL